MWNEREKLLVVGQSCGHFKSTCKLSYIRVGVMDSLALVCEWTNLFRPPGTHQEVLYYIFDHSLHSNRLSMSMTSHYQRISTRMVEIVTYMAMHSHSAFTFTT